MFPVYVTPRRRTCLGTRKPGWRRFSLEVTLTVSVVKTAQKKEGRGETTWGDNIKGVVL